MLLAGFPNQNINYLRICYGPTCASAYERVGKITSQPRILLQTTLSLFMSLLFTMFMLLTRFTIVPVGRMAAHGTLRVLHGAHYACSHTASIVQGFCGVTKAMLRKAPSFLIGTSQLIAHEVRDVITDIANGQIGQRIATSPLYLIIPVAVWLLMAEYYSTRA
ncbi:hypothetical protein BJ165DRAFT_135479 [Panaeolus papilionaceus]|nr:hypothetical protein BJ165DRAFT_135479 [Panaeolus papilionaceus]